MLILRPVRGRGDSCHSKQVSLGRGVGPPIQSRWACFRSARVLLTSHTRNKLLLGSRPFLLLLRERTANRIFTDAS
jgi:hypothetical protein